MISTETLELLAPNHASPRKPGDFFRNHQDAPFVVHPTELKKDGTPKRVLYGRPSSFGSALDSAYNLLKWRERQLLIGASALVDEYGVDGIDTDTLDRDALDGLAARCHQAAGSHLAADQGTHIHLLCELFDGNDLVNWPEHWAAGEALGIPATLQEHIVMQWDDFRNKLGLIALAIEATVVHDGWRLAGTLDRLDVCDHDILTGFGIIGAGVPFIGDIKTGSLTLGRDGQPNYWVKYPVQLAAYADGVPYDVDTDERTEWMYLIGGGVDWKGDINQDIAMIYHYDLATALTGQPTDWQAIPVNLTAGREGGNLCRAAADFGKRRDLFLMPTPKPVDQQAPTSPNSTGVVTTESGNGNSWPEVDAFHIVVSDGRRGSVTVPTSRTYIHQKIRELAEAGHEQVIRQMWPQGVPPLTDTSHTVEQLTQLFHMVRRVQAEVSAPFDPEPPPPVEQPPVQACLHCHGLGVEHPFDSSHPCEHPCPRCSPAQPAAPDDGAFLDPPEIEQLKQRMLALPDHRHIQLAAIAREAADAGRPISVKQKPCVRRWEIARALVLWAETDKPVSYLWTAAAVVAVPQHTFDPDVTLGALISQFTIEQACQLADNFQQDTVA